MDLSPQSRTSPRTTSNMESLDIVEPCVHDACNGFRALQRPNLSESEKMSLVENLLGAEVSLSDLICDASGRKGGVSLFEALRLTSVPSKFTTNSSFSLSDRFSLWRGLNPLHASLWSSPTHAFTISKLSILLVVPRRSPRLWNIHVCFIWTLLSRIKRRSLCLGITEVAWAPMRQLRRAESAVARDLPVPILKLKPYKSQSNAPYGTTWSTWANPYHTDKLIHAWSAVVRDLPVLSQPGFSFVVPLRDKCAQSFYSK